MKKPAAQRCFIGVTEFTATVAYKWRYKTPPNQAYTLSVCKNVPYRTKHRCQRDVTRGYFLAWQANLGCSMIKICIYSVGSEWIRKFRVTSRTGIARDVWLKALPAESTRKLTLNNDLCKHYIFYGMPLDPGNSPSRRSLSCLLEWFSC